MNVYVGTSMFSTLHLHEKSVKKYGREGITQLGVGVQEEDKWQYSKCPILVGNIDSEKGQICQMKDVLQNHSINEWWLDEEDNKIGSDWVFGLAI